MASREPPGQHTPTPSSGNLGYDRFVIGELSELLKQEDARQIALEKKAALAATLTLAVSAYCLDAARVAHSNGFVSATAGLWVLFCVVCVLARAYHAIGVSKCSAVKPLQLLGADVRKQDEGLRHEGYAIHLGSTLADVRRFGETKAHHVHHVQQWALVGTTSALAFLVFHIFCMPSLKS